MISDPTLIFEQSKCIHQRLTAPTCTERITYVQRPLRKLELKFGIKFYRSNLSPFGTKKSDVQFLFLLLLPLHGVN